MKKIAIVGGGASGTILTLHLLNKAQYPLEIWLSDASSEVGRGIAYNTGQLHYVLNVPCSKMGAYASQPDGFYNWLLYHGYQYKGLDFVPRNIYGNYLQDLLEQNIKANPQHKIHIVKDKVVAIHPGQPSTIFWASGEQQKVDEIVLATGNLAPKKMFAEGKNVYNQPWENSFWDKISTDESLVLLGTGLTAIDYVVELYKRKHRGKIYMISRNGRFPLVHEEPCMQGLLKNYFHPDDSLSILLKKINAIKRNPFLKIIRPVCVIEELRNLFPRMWFHWTVEERKLFYRRLYPIWNIHRHRIPPETNDIIQEGIQNGQIQVVRGCIEKVCSGETIEIQCRDRTSGSLKMLQSQYLINCTGPDADFTQSGDALIQQLLADGQILCDALHTGLKCNAKMQLIGKDGVQKHLWGIGPMLKSMFFESTAIHEIRNQSEALSDELLR